MPDAFVIVAPLFLLLVVGLMRFIGCSSFGSAADPIVTVSVSPPLVQLGPGKEQDFFAQVEGTPNPAVNWYGATPNPDGPSARYTAPFPYVRLPGGVLTFTVTAISEAAPAASGSATVILVPPINNAVFVKSDAVTAGNWRGVYGSKGYVLADMPEDRLLPTTYLPALDTSALPVYTWAPSTADPRGLQKPSGTGRFAATWFDAKSLTLNFDFNDSAPHQVALYCIDWDALGRTQQIDMLADGTTTPETQNLVAFDGGRYLVWDLTGTVHLTITRKGAQNAVLSGIFFD
jgi:hypothetical protein